MIETPTNPTVQVVDIKAVSKITKERNILFVVDNTFLTPYFQKPLELGADIALYSLTKFMNGHSDVLMGSIALNNEELYKKIKFLQIGKYIPSSKCHSCIVFANALLNET